MQAALLVSVSMMHGRLPRIVSAMLCCFTKVMHCGVQFITTNLMLLASVVVFNVNPLISLPIWALFLLIDGAYLSANLAKFLNGAVTVFACILPYAVCKADALKSACFDTLSQLVARGKKTPFWCAMEVSCYSDDRWVVPDSPGHCGVLHQLYLVLWAQ